MAVETRIDLSKIPVKETASKIVKLDFGYGEKEYRIHALDDAMRQCIGLNEANDKDVLKTFNLYKLLLVGGLDAVNGDQGIADYLIRNATDAALKAGNEILMLTVDFYSAKDKEAEAAEKNSDTESPTEKTEDSSQSTAAGRN